MVWGKLAARCALAGWVVAGLSAQAQAETMVVRASGPSAPSYKPGSKLVDGGSLVLKAGDVVTLLDAKGTRTLRGPGRFSVATSASAAPASNVMLSALLDTKRVRRARTGAVRGTLGEAPATPPRRPNLWMVDVAQSGTLCVANPAALRLWRADAARPATVKISDGSVDTTANFAAGESVAVWPAAAPVRDGAAYRLSDGMHVANIRFALLGTVPPELDSMASSLMSHQCSAQLDLLVETAALSDGSARN